MFPVSQIMMPTTVVDVMSNRDMGSSLIPNCAPSSDENQTDEYQQAISQHADREIYRGLYIAGTGVGDR